VTDSNPTPIQACLERLNAGDPAARNELLRLTTDRLLAMVRKMLARYPGVRRWEESDDVLQNVMVRLDRCLAAQGQVRSPTDYLRLAATNMRRELIDLARRYYGPHGVGANHATPNGKSLEEHADAAPTADRDDPAALLVARELHEAIDALPAEVREVAEFHWYLGMTKSEAAAALGLSLSTVKRRCIEAKLLLEKRIGTRSDP
jgi:RNA polymerase sigma-70 factor (ECF subfamily)